MEKAIPVGAYASRHSAFWRDSYGPAVVHVYAGAIIGRQMNVAWARYSLAQAAHNRLLRAISLNNEKSLVSALAAPNKVLLVPPVAFGGENFPGRATIDEIVYRFRVMSAAVD